nr:MAG TPA: polynucleotide kinase [Crassvirales sp.]
MVETLINSLRIYQKTLISFSVMDIYKECNMNRLIICRGLPASGKTTWAKEWVMEDPEHRIRINLDDIRSMLGKYWVPAREPVVSAIQQEAILAAMNFGVDIVIDNTNLNRKVVDAYVKVAEKFKYTVEYKDFFNVPLVECINRNVNRNASIPEDVQIPNDVIFSMHELYKDIYNLKVLNCDVEYEKNKMDCRSEE